MTPETAARKQAEVRNKFATKLARDLSTMTEAEIRENWNSDQKAAVEKIEERPFDEFIANHNPIYYLAENTFFANDPSLLWPPLHRDKFCDLLLRNELRDPKDFAGSILIAQRGSFKSSFTHKAHALFVQLRAKHVFDRDLNVAIIHHRIDQASSNFVNLKSVIANNPWFKRVWPDAVTPDSMGTKTEMNMPWRAVGTGDSDMSYVAFGLNSKTVGKHQHRQIISDPVDDDHITSPIVRQMAEQKFDMAAFMLDPKDGRRVIDGTRYHMHDLHGKNIASGLYDVLVVKAIECDGKPFICQPHKELGKGSCLESFIEAEDAKDRNYRGCYNAGLSFPTRHTYPVLGAQLTASKKGGGTGLFWWLQQQAEVRSSIAITGDSRWYVKCKLSEVSPNAWRVIVVDPAWKGTENHGRGCDAAILVWAIERKGNLLIKTLLDGVVSNELFPDDGLREIRRLAGKWNVVPVAPEERGHTGLKSAIVKEFTSVGKPVDIIDLKTTNQGKIPRMVTFLGEARSGQIYISDSTPEAVVVKLCEQTDDFPQCTEHVCDTLDASAYTCDPAIADAYVPVFATHDEGPWAKLPWYMRPRVESDHGFGTLYNG